MRKLLFLLLAGCLHVQAQGIVYMMDGTSVEVVKAAIDGNTATLHFDEEGKKKDEVKVKKILKIEMAGGERFVRAEGGKYKGYWIRIDTPDKKLVIVPYTMHASGVSGTSFSSGSTFQHISTAVMDANGTIIAEEDITNTPTNKSRGKRKKTLEMIHKYFGGYASKIKDFPTPENGKDDDLSRVVWFLIRSIVTVT